MAFYSGKLEREITVVDTGNGGWDVNLTDDLGGPTLVTIPAATYYHSSAGSGTRDLGAEFKFRADAAMGGTWACNIANGENESGKSSISNTTGVCTVTWVDDDLRDVLGFETDDDLSGSGSYTSSDQARGLWLPNRPKISPYGDSDDGWHETDMRWTESASGHVKTLYSTRKQVLALAWEYLEHKKVRIAGESVTNESFERFWADCILGIETWAAGGPTVRYYPDADTDATYTTYKLVGEILSSFRPEQLVENSLLHWRVILDRMVVVPS
jgi:hypothetical protein